MLKVLTAADTQCYKTVNSVLAGGKEGGGWGWGVQSGLLRCCSGFIVGIYIHSGRFTERFLHIKNVQKATQSSAGERAEKI